MKRKLFMTLPLQIMDVLSENEMLFISGGNSIAPSVNNGSGLCSDTNNSDGRCSGTNNSSGKCLGTNNDTGRCGLQPGGPDNQPANVKC